MPGAPHARSVCSLKIFCSRLALAADAPAVGARKYMSEKFSMLPTWTLAASVSYWVHLEQIVYQLLNHAHW